MEEEDVPVVILSGDSGYIPGNSGPEGPEYPGVYPEYPDLSTRNPRLQKSKDFAMGFA